MHSKFLNNFKNRKSNTKRQCYAKKLKLHVMPLTQHEKYDGACTINERFERPWQPLKGISIKRMYVPELSYPTSKKIYKFKGAT
jgi:hypothetical protein